MPDNMSFMSNKRQQELVDAVKDAADLHLDGTAATDAIAKVASERDMSENETRLMVEAFNTSKTLAHLRSAEGPEKAASFDLADFDEALAKAFPNKEEVKVAFVNDYEFSESIPNVFTLSQAMSEKVATVLTESQEGVPLKDASEVSSHFDTPDDLRYRKAYNALDYWRKKAEAHQTKAAEMRGQVLQACSSIADDFLTTDGLREWATFAKEAEQLHGEVGKKVAAHIAEEFGINQLMARHGAKEAAVTLPDPDTDRHKLLKIAILSMDEAFDEASKEAECRGRYESEKASWFRSGGVKKAGLMSGMGMAAIMGKGGGAAPAAPAAPPVAPMIPDVGIEGEYDNAKLQLELQDMIESDDVISSHATENPHSVLSAVRELADIHPNILKQPMALRAALRRHLEMGHTELHELEQIKNVADRLDIEKARNIQRAFPRPVSGGA